MTIRNGLFFENNKSGQHAQDVRLMLKGLLGGTTGTTTGVGGGTHLMVTEKAGTPDMSVDVAPGHFFIEGSRNSAQGTYHGYNDATVNVPLSASDPTNPRIDIIHIRARDSQYDAGFDTLDDVELLVAEGTPAAVPDPPTITDEDYIELARVTVGANVSAIEDADIEDTRPFSQVITANQQAAMVATLEGTTSTDYGDLATPGPSVTVETGRRALVIVAANVTSPVDAAALMSFEVSGASSVPAADARAVNDSVGMSSGIRSANVVLLDSLNPGINTFTAKYRRAVVGSPSTVSFDQRLLAVVPLP